jgi:hypothetical protein
LIVQGFYYEETLNRYRNSIIDSVDANSDGLQGSLLVI